MDEAIANPYKAMPFHYMKWLKKKKKERENWRRTENVIRTTTVVMSLQGQIYNLQITSFNGKSITTPSTRFQKDSSIGR